MNIEDLLRKIEQTAASVVKIAIKSHGATPMPLAADGEELVILGNGPSLNDTMSQHQEFLNERRLLAVNFFANTPSFLALRPCHYVLADPHFFVALTQPNVVNLWNALAAVDWKMTLFIPSYACCRGDWYTRLTQNASITLVKYNMTPVEGFDAFTHRVYSAGLGMPRPRNVLIPSIMLGIGMRYKTVYIAGADHSWTKTLSVNDDNQVVSIQPHFYKEEEKEQQRIKVDYMKYPLHQILQSFYVAFKSYFDIRRYADRRGVTIYNITPGSFIDAFLRKRL